MAGPKIIALPPVHPDPGVLDLEMAPLVMKSSPLRSAEPVVVPRSIASFAPPA